MNCRGRQSVKSKKKKKKQKKKRKKDILQNPKIKKIKTKRNVFPVKGEE